MKALQPFYRSRSLPTGLKTWNPFFPRLHCFCSYCCLSLQGTAKQCHCKSHSIFSLKHIYSLCFPRMLRCSLKSRVFVFRSYDCRYSTWVQQCDTLVISVLQLARYSTEGLLQLGPLGSTTFLPDTKCLVDDGRGRTPRLKKCDAVSRISQRLWDFTQVKRKHTLSSFDIDLHRCSTPNVMKAKIRHMLLNAITTGVRIGDYFMNELLVLQSSVLS